MLFYKEEKRMNFTAQTHSKAVRLFQGRADALLGVFVSWNEMQVFQRVQWKVAEFSDNVPVNF